MGSLYKNAKRMARNNREKRKYKKILLIIGILLFLYVMWFLRYIGITQDNADLSASLVNASVTINGEPIKEGEKINALTPFDVSLTFQIDLRDNVNRVFSYKLPNSIHLSTAMVDVPLIENGVQTGTYSITKDGEVTVTLYDEYASGNDYSTVSLSFNAEWAPGSSGPQEVDFGNGHKYNVILDYDTDVKFEKKHQIRWPDKRKADFEIKVTAYTEQNNIKITDTLNIADKNGNSPAEGANLIVGEEIVITITNKNGENKTGYPVKVAITDDNTLTRVVDEINNSNIHLDAGDTLLIKYPMEYKDEVVWKADKDDNYLYLKNTATYASDEKETPEVAEDSWDYYGSQKNVLTKNSMRPDEDLTSIKWEITFNDALTYQITNTTEIGDSLQSQYLSYDTSKNFEVKVYDTSKNYVETYIVPWNEILNSGNRSFTYHPPEKDYGKNRLYIITYYTKTSEDCPETEQLGNSANVRLTQMTSPIGTGGVANNYDIGITKVGSPNEENRTVDWKIDITVYPGSAEIKDLFILDQLPSYVNKQGQNRYSQIINSNGITWTDPNIYSNPEAYISFIQDAMEVTVTQYGGDTDYTNASEFKTLQDWIAMPSYPKEGNSEGYPTNDMYFFEAYPLSNVWAGKREGFNLPSTNGKYASGYVITVKYTTTASDCEDGTTLINTAGVSFKNQAGEEVLMSNVGKASFAIRDVENSVNVEKSVEYNKDSDRLLYTVVIDPEKVGLKGATKMKWVDEFDSRLEMPMGDKLYFELNLEKLYNWEEKTILEVPLYEINNKEYQVTKTSDTTFKLDSTFKVATLGGVLENLCLTYGIDPESNKFFVEFNVVPVENITNSPIKFTIKYMLKTKESGYGNFEDLRNHFKLYGNDEKIVYGEDVCTTTLKRGCLQKELDISKEEANLAKFNIDIDLTEEILNKNELIIEDVMTNCLVPDLENMVIDFYYTNESIGVKDFGFGLNNIYNAYKILYNKEPNFSISKEWNGDGFVTIKLDFGEDTTQTIFDVIYKIAEINYGVSGIVPEDVQIGISYNARITGSPGTIVNVGNTAKIKGIQNSESETSKEYEVKPNSGETTGIATTFTIKKIDSELSSDGTYKTLKGAKYELFDENGNKLAEGTTDENGLLTMGKNGTDSANCALTTYKAYYIVEKTPPEGEYILDSAQYWFYMTDPTGLKEDKTPADEETINRLNDLGCNAIEMSGTIIRTNSKTASLVITKYSSVTNALLTGAEFKIYNDKKCTESYQVSTDLQDGRYVIRKLEKGHTYYLKEVISPKNHQLSNDVHEVYVGNDGIILVDGKNLNEKDNTLHITNEPYSLPTTGGNGTLIYTVTGITLMLIGSILLIKRKNKMVR